MTTSGLLASLPGRYAKALFDLSEAEQNTESVAESLTQFQKTVNGSLELQFALKDPTISREDISNVLVDICTALKTPRLLASFLHRLALSQRLELLNKIIEIFFHQVHTQKGEKEIDVYSARALTKDQTQQLHQMLTRAFQGKLTINFTLDPHLLGGILIRTGSKVIDASLETLLNRLATLMKGTA